MSNVDVPLVAPVARDTEAAVQRSVKALAWNYGGTVLSIGVQLVVGIFLARVLGPGEFGLAAVGMLLAGIVGLLTDFGFGSALIQAESVTEKDYGFVFLVQTAFGATLSLLVWLASTTIAGFFRVPDAGPLVAAISVVFLLQAIGQSSAAILRKNLNFKAVQTVSVLSYLIGYVALGLPLAIYGAGAWSLVAAQITQSALVAAGMFVLAPMSMKLTFSPDNRGLISFGRTVLLTNLCNSALTTFDGVLVGRFAGPAGLGLYNRVMVLIATPINSLTGAVQGVLFASCSQARVSGQQLKEAYQATCALLGLICFPVCASVAVIPATTVIAIYGHEWAAGASLMTPLALAIGIGSALSVIGPILTAQGRVVHELRAQLSTLVLMVPIAYLAVQYSVLHLAWAILCIYLLRWVFLMAVLRKALSMPYSELLKPFLWPLVCAFVSAAAAFGTDRTVGIRSDAARLAMDILASAVAMILSMWVFRHRMMSAPHGHYISRSFPRIEKFLKTSSQ